MAAAIGNNYAAKAKEFTDRVRKLSVQENWKRVEKAAEKLLDSAAEGEPWAIQVLADRLEGKPAQRIEGVDGNALTFQLQVPWLAQAAQSRGWMPNEIKDIAEEKGPLLIEGGQVSEGERASELGGEDAYP